MDSLQFMDSSLERLAANLPLDAFKYTSKVFQDEKLVSVKIVGTLLCLLVPSMLVYKVW